MDQASYKLLSAQMFGASINDISNWASIAGLLVTLLALILAVVAFRRAEREAREAEAARSRTAKRLEQVESLNAQILEIVVSGAPDASSQIAEAISRSTSESPLVLREDENEQAAKLRISSEPGIRGDVDIEFSRRLVQRGPRVWIVGTRSHGLWKLSERHNHDLNAVQILGSKSPITLQSGDPPKWVTEHLADLTGDAQGIEPIDVFRRKTRGSQQWIVRASGNRWFEFTKANRTSNVTAREILQ